MEKICSKCKISQDIENFSKDKNKKDGHGYVCKTCTNTYLNERYAKNSKEHCKATYQVKVKNRKENRIKMLEYLKICKCIDCENNDVRVLEFDHISNNKTFSVNQLLQEGRGWKRIKEEIDKCEVVCANCHRIRTYARKASYRNL